MLQVDDIVKEIATERQGRINQVRTSEDGKDCWVVRFSDGEEPVIKIFENENELELIERSSEDDGGDDGGIIITDPIMA